MEAVRAWCVLVPPLPPPPVREVALPSTVGGGRTSGRAFDRASRGSPGVCMGGGGGEVLGIIEQRPRNLYDGDEAPRTPQPRYAAGPR